MGTPRKKSGFDPKEKLSEHRQLIISHDGSGSTNNLVSSLRKDRSREINARGSACEASGYPAYQSGSLDVASLPAENRSIEDFARLSARLRAAMGPHVVDILRQDVSVVLD